MLFNMKITTKVIPRTSQGVIISTDPASGVDGQGNTGRHATCQSALGGFLQTQGQVSLEEDIVSVVDPNEATSNGGYTDSQHIQTVNNEGDRLFSPEPKLLVQSTKRGGNRPKGLGPIHLVQLNAQHSKGATANLLKTLTEFKGAYVALVQEPWVYRDQVRGLQASDCSVFAFLSGENPRAAISCSKSLKPAYLPQLSTRDLTVVQIQIPVSNRCMRTFVVASSYHHFEIPIRRQGFEKLVDYCHQAKLPLVIGMDANAHNVVWGSTDTNNRGEEMLDFIVSSDLQLLNKGNTPTFVTSRREEVLDISLANSEGASLIQNWHVSEDDSLSDHRQIHLEITASNVPRIWARNPRRTNWEIYENRLQWFLPRVPNKELSYDELDSLAKSVEDAIRRAYFCACPLRRSGSKKQPPWWMYNPQELSYLRTETRKSFRKAMTSKVEADWDTYRTCRREYKAAIQEAKRSSWRKFCQDVEKAPEMAKLSRILKAKSCPELGMVKLPDGTFTNNYGQVLEYMLETHFPNCVVDGQTGYQSRNPTQSCWREIARTVTPNRVHWAVADTDPYKAPGPDGIYPIFLHRGIGILNPFLVVLYQSSLALGYIPKAWQAVRVVFIPKPGKDNYSIPKAFRPISLSSYMLKVLEKLVDRRLKDSYIIMHPLHEKQHAYQSGKSTETALHAFVTQVEKAFNKRQYALACFLDIEGAFDNAQFDDIKRALVSKGVAPVLVDWSTAMLSQRCIQAQAGDAHCSAVVQQGTAQGGVLSALFWVLVVDELLHLLNQNGYATIGYSDDTTIILQGPDLGELCYQMQVALYMVEQWCKNRKMKINPGKTELMIFTRKRTCGGYRNITLHGTALNHSSQVKYLGVILDCKLTWTAHIETKCKKAIAAFYQCRRAIGKDWGASPATAYWLYTAVIRPALAYAAVVWWMGAQRVDMTRRLSKIQRMACLYITGAMGTTPTAALEVLCGLLPLSLYVQTEAMKTAYRFNQTGVQAGYQGRVIVGHTQIWAYFGRIPGMRVVSDYLKPEYHFSHAYLTKVSTRVSKHDIERMEDQSVLNCFVSSSQQAETPSNPNSLYWTGIGIYSDKASIQESISLGQHTTAFQAIVYAIQCCVEILTTKVQMDPVVMINTTNQAAVRALQNPRITSKVVLGACNALNQLAKRAKIQVNWISGHLQLKGFELANGLAKASAMSVQEMINPVGISPTVGNSLLKNWASDAHSKRWKELRECKQAKQNIGSIPKYSMSKWFRSQKREYTRLLSCILTGHCFLNRHLFLLGLSTTGKCETCKRKDETLTHFLCECPEYKATRLKIFGRNQIKPAEVANLKWPDLIKYVQEIGKKIA